MSRTFSCGGIHPIGNEILDTYKNGILTHLDGGNYCILLSFEHMPSTSREVQKQLHNFFQHIRETKTDINNAQMVFTDMIGVLLRICKEKNLSLETIFYDSIKPAQALSQLNTLDQIQEWFTKTFQHLCSELNRQLSGDSVYVQKALSIIHQNYDKPVSLQSIAEEIGISFGYLSTIFKSETGQNFSEYLNSYRISIAKKMLDYGETDFHKISRTCGFQDYSYFFKVFKKVTNVTPTNYLKTKTTSPK